MTTLSRMRSQISSTQTFPNGLIVTSGSVGIGTNSPIQLLDVSGYINAQSIELSALWSVIQNNGYYDGAWKYRANGMAWGIGNNFGGSSNGVSIAVASTNAGGANALLTWLPVFNVTNNQRVGINAVSPSTALEVYGSITSRPASTQDAIIISGRAGGTSSYAVTFTPTTLTANQTITLPNTTGTLITTGDSGTVTNTMLAGSIANTKLLNSSITVNGTSIALGASGTITAAATNALTIGTGLSGTSYNGSSAVTIAIDNTVALRADTTYIGTTAVALNRTTANLALTGIASVAMPSGSYTTTIQGSSSATASYTLTFPVSAGTNGQVLTTNGSGVLSWTTVSGGGGGATLTIGTGLSGTSYNGSSAVTIALNLGNANTWTGAQTFSLATKTDRMLGNYIVTYSTANRPFDMTYNLTLNMTDGLAIQRLATIVGATSAGIPEVNWDSAYGSTYGTKKVGLGFHVGTYNQITREVSQLTPTSGVSDNVNAVIFGYMGTGPRIIASDYDLLTESLNTIRYIATKHHFAYGDVVIGAGEDATTVNIGSVLRGSSGIAGSTDIPGANLTIAAGASTGAGVSGNLIFQTAPAAGTTGSTLNSYVERMRITSSGNIGAGTNSPNSTFHVNGSVAFNTSSISANTTLDGTYTHVFASGTITITLPTAVGIAGRTYWIKRTGTGTITIATTASQTIDGAASLSITAQYDSYTIVSDGSNWFIM